MPIWLVRAGARGEYEQKFVYESRIYMTRHALDVNLAELEQRAELTAVMTNRYPDARPKMIQSWVGRLWSFAHEIKRGDLVVLPLKTQPVIHIGEVIGNYHADLSGPNPFYHWRQVKWIAEGVPRSHFGEDLLSSFGAVRTVGRVRGNNAEERIAAMRGNCWKPEAITWVRKPKASGRDSTTEDADLESLARDQIARRILLLEGHDLTRLIETILNAKGYSTYRSPPGAQGGAYVLAGLGPLSFGEPCLCATVKTSNAPIGRTTVAKLLGAMTRFGAREGLCVSWNGFGASVRQELAASSSRVRLWARKELLEQLLSNYPKLSKELKAELPLKRAWIVATHCRTNDPSARSRFRSRVARKAGLVVR